MTKYLYRFRKFSDLKGSLEAGRESELEGLYIYFSPPEKLNDPLEGHREMIWRGDKILWENLFAHYFLCLARRHIESCEYINLEDIPFTIRRSYLEEPLDEFTQLKEVSQTFLNHPNVQAHIKTLAYKERSVKKSELMLHLNLIHNFALHVISNYLVEFGLIQKGMGINGESPKELLLTSSTILEFYKGLSSEELTSASEDIATSPLVPIEEHNLKLNYAIWKENKNQRWMDLSINFPEYYITALKELCTNNWYTACFMESCKNASIWGTYGSEHKGACLKFKVDGTVNAYTLDLGFPSEKHPSPITNRKLNLATVQYDGNSPELDFFYSLGAIPELNVKADWLTRNGTKSSRYDAVFSNLEKWRSEYHANEKKSIITKTKDWSGEVEMRILLQAHHEDFKPTESRKLRYNFQQLESIIFGVNMPLLHKLDLIETVEKLCIKHNRENFVFQQAYYTKNKEIGYRPIHKVEI